MERNKLNLMRASLQAADVNDNKRAAIMAILNDDKGTVGAELPPALLTQAQKARQLNISRFTVRKLTKLGKLHPVELLPGLLRYRPEELL
jgi:hypothetical protein